MINTLGILISNILIMIVSLMSFGCDPQAAPTDTTELKVDSTNKENKTEGKPTPGDTKPDGATNPNEKKSKITIALISDRIFDEDSQSLPIEIKISGSDSKSSTCTDSFLFYKSSNPALISPSDAV